MKSYVKLIKNGLLALLILSSCQSALANFDVITDKTVIQSDNPLTINSSITKLPAKINLIETQLGSTKDLKILYKKYQLDNGLVVILTPDHTDPLVHVNVTYHVGSAREKIGKSGYAHLFEHMMFEGSKHVAPTEHFKIITQAGGVVNGSTNNDYTNYYETIPSNQLEKALWLEADRMGFLLQALSQKKFENQLATVKNERAQRYDNQPYGLVMEKIAQALYPQSHPYNWLPIGSVADLNRATLQDIQQFFLRWYGPNNATLTIGGDFNEQETLNWIAKYFSSIPAGPKVKSAAKQSVSLAADRYITYEDKIKQPLLMLVYPTTHAGGLMQVYLDMLAKIIGQGKNSLLYTQLVKPGIATNAGAFHSCSELACNFYIYAYADSTNQQNLPQIRHSILEILSSFAKKGITKEELAPVKGQAKAAAISSLESIASKVNQLAYNQTLFKQPDRLASEYKQISSATTNDLNQAYKTFIYQHPSLTLSVVAKGDPQSAAAVANFAIEPVKIKENQPATDNLKVLKPIKDNFDRSLVPATNGAIRIKLPSIWRDYLKNKIEILGTYQSQAPTIAFNIYIKAGERYALKNKIGIAGLTASMLNGSTKNKSESQLQIELDTLGSSINFYAANNYSVIAVECLPENLDETLKLVAEKLFKPAFKLSEFKFYKKQLEESIIAMEKDPAAMAEQALREVIYGKTRYSIAAQGSLNNIKNLDLGQVKNFYNKYYSPKGAFVVIAGSIKQEQLVNKFAFLNNWHGKKAIKKPLTKLPIYKKSQIWLVNKENAPQTFISFARTIMPYDITGDYFKLRLANFNLGGNFNSRLMLNLREDKGFTYGVNGIARGNREVGLLEFSAHVKANKTLAAIIEMQRELNKMAQSGPTATEVDFMRLAVSQADALNYATLWQKLTLMSKLKIFNLDKDYIAEQNKIIKTISQEQLAALSANWFKAHDYQIIVVGDREKLEPQLKELGLKINLLELE